MARGFVLSPTFKDSISKLVVIVELNGQADSISVLLLKEALYMRPELTDTDLTPDN